MTTETKIRHTPGPWIFRPRGASELQHIEADHKTIVQVWDFPEAEANARLITAAPDLLAALKELLEDPDYQIAVGGNPYGVAAMLSRARAAIAKAESEESSQGLGKRAET